MGNGNVNSRVKAPEDKRIGEYVPERRVIPEQPEVTQANPPVAEDRPTRPVLAKRDDVTDHRQVTEHGEKQQRHDRQRVQRPIVAQRPTPATTTGARTRDGRRRRRVRVARTRPRLQDFRRAQAGASPGR